MARSLIAEFGSLRELLSADAPRWAGKAGIGPARYATLMAALELARRHLMEPLRARRALDHPGYHPPVSAGAAAGSAVRGVLLPVPGQSPPADRF